MTGERILIIDDKVEIIGFLTDLLEPLGYVLSVALDGQEGLARALEEQPDLVLLDLNMPGMSGTEVLEALHRHNCRSPVILMTLYGSESVVVRALRLGVRDYISKPFDIDELLVAIEEALEKGRLQRERERLVAELGEANRKIKLRMRELSALQAVGRSVASLMSRKELLRRILDAAIYLSGADAGALFLLNRENDELCLEAIRQGEAYHSGWLTEVHDSHAEDALRSGQPVWISKSTKRTGVTAYLGERAHSLLYVPVRFGKGAIGVMGVACLYEGRSLSSEVASRLATLADYAAMALRNAQLYEDLQRQTRQLATVNHIAQMIASSLDLREIMHTVVRSLKDSLCVETATLVLLDEESGELVFEIMLSDGEEKQGPFRMAMGQGIVGWVVQNGRSLRVNDVSQDPRFYGGVDQITGFRTRSILSVPLKISDRVIGAIEAINKLDERLPEGGGTFTEEDENLLCRAAAFVAIAVENARLHAAMRETIATQTVRDTMVTLSHYVNNPLQALLGAANLLRTDPGGVGDEHGRTHDTAGQVVDLIKNKVKEIAVVISVLRDIAVPESTVYLGSVQMLDIERELQARLESAISR